MPRFQALLLDLDGVFHVGDHLLPGAVDTLALLRKRQIPFRIITNTTTRSRRSLVSQMNRIGLGLQVHDVISAPYAAVLYLRERGKTRCRFVVSDDARAEFAEFTHDDVSPDLIVLGDVEDHMTYSLLNSIFNQMMNGAELIALHKGRFWQVPKGLRVDLGLFVAGLEYTTGQRATIIGKPAPALFELAMAEMQVDPADCAMIGDDLVNDVGGAQNAGLKGILVKTGKYRPGYEITAEVSPDVVLDSLFDLASIL